MDDVRIGRLLRALRVARGLRQVDVAVAAGLSQSLVSLIERGHLETVSIRSLRALFTVVEARFDGNVTWRGGAIDRLLDERHATLVGGIAVELGRVGWDVELEVTFSEFGDRGSIDILALRCDLGIALVILALRCDLGIALVIEIKSELTAVDDTIRRIDVKERLVAKVVLDRFGWRPGIVGRLLVILDTATNRRRVAGHEASLTPPFPARGLAVRRWLREPSGRLAGLRFLSPTNGRGTRRTRRRPRAPRGVDPGAHATRVDR